MKETLEKTTVLVLFLFIVSCTMKDYQSLPTYSDDHFMQAVVEIPAGTNHHIDYDNVSHRFIVSRVGGKERIVRFLPAPGNYGFIPSTHIEKGEGLEGESLDVLILSESMPTGSVVEIVPIGVLSLKTQAGLDHKIIGFPADTSKRIINTDGLYGFEAHFPMAKHIIEEWFLAVHSSDSSRVVGWQDEVEARQVIDKWTKKKLLTYRCDE
jgi:inorganic pyrophosphatase